MPRVHGQIDEGKRQAILEAAASVFAESGLSAPLDGVAQRAGVSRQTVYNQFGGREGLLRALIEVRRSEVVAPLDAAKPGDTPEQTLAAYALALMRRWVSPGAVALMRVAIAAAGEHPELARIVLLAGPREGRARLAMFLRQEHALGRLTVPDPDSAALMFAGMASGALLLDALLGGESLPEPDLEARSLACAARFCKAFAPV